ncbi:MAG: hypothetical protein IJ520_00830 [Synergistaceae bacterium]|nr:hypothetical protein [Synergistaceae bacterium]
MMNKRKGSVGGTIVAFFLALLAVVGGIYYYYHMSSEDMTQDRDFEDAGKILRDIEVSDYNSQWTFGDFMKNGAIGKPEFTMKPDADYHNFSVFEKSSSEFVRAEQFKNVLMSIIQGGRLTAYDDKTGFLLEKDGLNWELEKEKLREAVFNGDSLSPQAASGQYGSGDLQKTLAEILRQQDQYDTFGFVRFFFGSSEKDVLVAAVYSMDTRTPTAYNAIPKARPGEGLKGIRRVRSNFIDEVLTQKIKFNAEFQSLSFSIEKPDFRIEDDKIEQCLTLFLEQLFDSEEKL